jgi:hypothetical protein
MSGFHILLSTSMCAGTLWACWLWGDAGSPQDDPGLTALGFSALKETIMMNRFQTLLSIKTCAATSCWFHYGAV